MCYLHIALLCNYMYFNFEHSNHLSYNNGIFTFTTLPKLLATNIINKVSNIKIVDFSVVQTLIKDKTGVPVI